MRFVGVSLMLFGAAVAWFLGVKGEDPATLRAQLFAFFHVQDPGAVLPGAQTVAPFPNLGVGLPAVIGSGASAAARAGQAVADAAKRIGGAPAPAPALTTVRGPR